jgi:segregation and condensation protein B
LELSTIILHIEALIFASEKPLASLEIVELINNAFGFMEERISLEQVESAIEEIREKYNSELYPFTIQSGGGGWQFLTKKDFHSTIAQLNGDKFLKRLSNTALETLAIIAYKQPITKGEIESIRGVNSDYSVQKLLEKELIVITGRNEELPGKPLIYCTSRSFMDYFGINSPADLPKIKEIFAEQIVEPTIISETTKTEEGADSNERPLAVNGNGELVEGNDAVPDEHITIEEENNISEESNEKLLEGESAANDTGSSNDENNPEEENN